MSIRQIKRWLSVFLLELKGMLTLIIIILYLIKKYWYYRKEIFSLSWSFKIQIIIVFAYLFPNHYKINSQFEMLFRFLVIMRIGDELFDSSLSTYENNSTFKLLCELKNLEWSDNYVLEKVLYEFEKFKVPRKLKYITFSESFHHSLKLLLTIQKGEEINPMDYWLKESIKLFIDCQYYEFSIANSPKISEYNKLSEMICTGLSNQILRVESTKIYPINRNNSFTILCKIIGLLDDLKDFYDDAINKRPNYLNLRCGVLVKSAKNFHDIKEKFPLVYREWKNEFDYESNQLKKSGYLCPRVILLALRMKYLI